MAQWEDGTYALTSDEAYALGEREHQVALAELHERDIIRETLLGYAHDHALAEDGFRVRRANGGPKKWDDGIFFGDE